MEKMRQAALFDDSDDPFRGLKRVFIDFGYHKFTKLLNAFMTLVNCFTLLLTVHFIRKNFDKDLIIKYAPSFIVIVYATTSMIIAIFLENQTFFLVSEHRRLFWAIDSAGSQARLFILKKAARINLYTYFVYTVAALWSIVLLPVFGSHREWLLAEEICEEYFGSGSKILYQMFISFIPFSIYSSLRHCGSLLYSILEFYLQMFLINQHILQICDDKTDLEKLTFEQRVQHENETFRKFCFCIDHHVVVTGMINKLLEMVRSVMAVFLFLGVLLSASTLYFMFYIFEDASNILKLRISLGIIFNAVVVGTFCHAGQMLIDESSCNFDTLAKCSWYNWNKRNKTVLHIFMTNCLKPFAITFAGMVLDYKMAIAMFRTACSYALVFYNLQKAAQI